MSMETGGAAHALTPESAVPIQSTAPTPGELLKAARTERNVTVQQIADDLHLDVRVVEAIETNNFALLGPPVYSRGHLRKYATLVGLSPDVIIAHYDMLSDVPVAAAPIPVSVTAPAPERVSLRTPLLIVAGIVVGALVLGIAAWLVNRLDSSPAATVEHQSVTAVPEVAAPVAQQPEEQAEGAVVPSAPSTPTPVAATQSALANVGNGVTMRLRFTEPSWVEIYDAADRRLMYGIGQAGQTTLLAGEPPLRVTLGLASAVSMEVNDRLVPVPRRAGRDAARFTVAADGSVR